MKHVVAVLKSGENLVAPQSNLCKHDCRILESACFAFKLLGPQRAIIAEAFKLRTLIRQTALTESECKDLARRCPSLQREGFYIVVPFPEKYWSEGERLWLSRDGLTFGRLVEAKGSFGYLIDRAVLSARIPLKLAVAWVKSGINRERFLVDYGETIRQFKKAIENAERIIEKEKDGERK